MKTESGFDYTWIMRLNLITGFTNLLCSTAYYVCFSVFVQHLVHKPKRFFQIFRNIFLTLLEDIRILFRIGFQTEQQYIRIQSDYIAAFDNYMFDIGPPIPKIFLNCPDIS